MITRIARVMDGSDGTFGLEYDNTRGERSRMRLEALTYDGALREAKSFLGIDRENRDDENVLWDVE